MSDHPGEALQRLADAAYDCGLDGWTREIIAVAVIHAFERGRRQREVDAACGDSAAAAGRSGDADG